MGARKGEKEGRGVGDEERGRDEGEVVVAIRWETSFDPRGDLGTHASARMFSPLQSTRRVMSLACGSVHFGYPSAAH